MEYNGYTIIQYTDQPKKRTMYSVCFDDAIHKTTIHSSDIATIKNYIDEHLLNSSEYDKRRQIEEQAIDSFYTKQLWKTILKTEHI